MDSNLELIFVRGAMMVGDIGTLLAGFGTIALAFFAYRGLSTWKNQKHTDIQLNFIEEFLEANHSFIHNMHNVSDVFSLIVMSVKTYETVPVPFELSKVKNATFIHYICQRGGSDSNKLQDKLVIAKSDLIKLNSLLTKGQIFGFIGYENIRKVFEKMMATYRKMEAVSAIIGTGKNMNWQNDQVQGMLESFFKVDLQDVKDDLAVSDVNITIFAKENYEYLIKN